jgi:hypothetical protein
MEPQDSTFEVESRGAYPNVLPVIVALIVLFLSVLYVGTFGYMLQVSLVEQVLAPDHHPPRYAPHVHYHNPAEWALIVGPLALGLTAGAMSLRYLARRAFRREASR